MAFVSMGKQQALGRRTYILERPYGSSGRQGWSSSSGKYSKSFLSVQTSGMTFTEDACATRVMPSSAAARRTFHDSTTFLYVCALRG